MLHFVKIDNYDNTKNNWNWKGLYTYYTKLYLKINLFTKVDLRRSVKILSYLPTYLPTYCPTF